MDFSEKEPCSDASYLRLRGLQGAGLWAKQLAVVKALYDWRGDVALAQHVSAEQILPDEALLKIAKKMPLNTETLLRMVGSKHPFVESKVPKLIILILQAIRNASSFESVAERLKEDRIQAPEQMGVSINISGKFADGSEYEHIPAHLQLNEEVAEATVPLLRKRRPAFDAMPGGSASKEKTDFTKVQDICGKNSDKKSEDSGEESEDSGEESEDSGEESDDLVSESEDSESETDSE